jgi:aspartyl-tRNA(Asn)/glutamyl-tRNA(Gln) amidotransferase subunit A
LTTGASSGGAVAAVASGMGQVALATDGGGSIRRPASHCGLVGLKPTTGRVARRNGLPVILDDCEVIGPIARTCADLALVFRAIARPHPEDRASLAFDPDDKSVCRDIATGPSGCRILYVPYIADHAVDDDIRDSCRNAAQRLRAMGHQVEDGPLPFDFALYEKHWLTVRDAGLAWGVRDREWQGRVSALHDGMIRHGQGLAAIDYVDALAAFREIQAQFGRFLRQYDLLMMPSAGCLPWPAEQEGPARNRVFTGIVNAAGYPAITIPSEPAPSGLPIGFQVVGPFGSDWSLIRLAAQFERQQPWAHRWPPL